MCAFNHFPALTVWLADLDCSRNLPSAVKTIVLPPGLCKNYLVAMTHAPCAGTIAGHDESEISAPNGSEDMYANPSWPGAWPTVLPTMTSLGRTETPTRAAGRLRSIGPRHERFTPAVASYIHGNALHVLLSSFHLPSLVTRRLFRPSHSTSQHRDGFFRDSPERGEQG